MKVLIIKTSSMGDILHTLPALTDAANAIANIEFHWVVEENFAEIPTWHKNVTNVIPIAFRRWRKNILVKLFSHEWRKVKQQLRYEQYDLVIDAQGLIKSALITRLTRGPKHGLDSKSARESLASLAYKYQHAVNKKQHAVTRVRQLFAQALHYNLPTSEANYGIDNNKLPRLNFSLPQNYIICLHGTTWVTKHYPLAYWSELITQLTAKQMPIVLPWGNDIEKQRAEQLAKNNALVTVLPHCNLSQIASVIANAMTVIAVDTGLSHLSAALHKPTIGLYGPTNPALTGTEGPNQIHLAATAPNCVPCLQRTCHYFGQAIQQPACFDSVNPDRIMQHLPPDRVNAE